MPSEGSPDKHGERSLLEVMAEHRARLVPVREAAEAGDPEAARAYAEGLALLQEAEAKQAEHDRLIRETAAQLAQLETLQEKVARLERQVAADPPPEGPR
jgi:hypothetical protein